MAAYVDAQYAPLGRGPVLFDCWGLVLDVRRRLGLSVPVDPMVAAQTPHEMAGIIAAAYRSDQWRQSDAYDGAVIMFPAIARALHAGVCLADGIFDISARSGLRWRARSDPRLPRHEVVQWV